MGINRPLLVGAIRTVLHSPMKVPKMHACCRPPPRRRWVGGATQSSHSSAETWQFGRPVKLGSFGRHTVRLKLGSLGSVYWTSWPSGLNTFQVPSGLRWTV